MRYINFLLLSIVILAGTMVVSATGFSNDVTIDLTVSHESLRVGQTGTGVEFAIEVTGTDASGTVQLINSDTNDVLATVNTDAYGHVSVTTHLGDGIIPNALGEFHYQAVISDQTACSSIVTVTVTTSSVILSSPSDESSYVSPTTVPLAATLIACDGLVIDKVEFYQGETLLQTLTSAPYAFDWSCSLTAGEYSLTAKVYIHEGDTLVSAPVSITLTEAISSLSAVSLAVTPESPQLEDPTITLTATATGGTVVEYQFTASIFNTQTSSFDETVIQSFSTTPTGTWTPTLAGPYTLSVTAREVGTETSVYSVPQSYLVSSATITNLTVTTDIASPQLINTDVELQAQSTYTGQSTVEYQFEVSGFNSQTNQWEICFTRSYSTVATCTWTPTKARDYLINVNAREVGTTVPYQRQSTNVAYRINTNCLTNIALTTPEKTSPQPPGFSIPIQASCTYTGEETLEYQFIVSTLNHVTQELDVSYTRPYNIDESCTWSPIESLDYILSVKIREVGDTLEYQTSIDYTIANTDPVAEDDSVTTLEDTEIQITASTLLANDTDGDGHTLTISGVSSASQQGSWVILAGTTIGYTPAENFNGEDTFTYTISDNYGGTASGVVTVTVTAVNDAPVATTQEIETEEDTECSIILAGTDVDEFDTLTYTVVTHPTHGMLTEIASNLTYTPDDDYTGWDSFSFQVSDGLLSSLPSTVEILINPLQDVPVAKDQSVTIFFNTPASISLQATDVDGDALTYTYSQPSNGTVTGVVPNVIYTPDTGYIGPDTFTFTVSDGTDSDTATITITVLDVSLTSSDIGDGRDAVTSADGQFVAFVSNSSTLTADDTNDAADIFLLNRQTATIQRINIASNDGSEANDDSWGVAISADGNCITFISSANNLVPGDTNNCSDVFVYDRLTNSLDRVSTDVNGLEGNGKCWDVSVSGTGRYIVFTSSASNLVAGDTNEQADIFIHDRGFDFTLPSDNTLTCCTLGGNGPSWGAAVSSDETPLVISFLSDADNLITGDSNDASDVFYFVLQTGIIERIGGPETDISQSGSGTAISATGRYIAFDSDSIELTNGDTNNHRDVFFFDCQLQQVRCVAYGSEFIQANGDCWDPSINADGQYIAFTSDATNLLADTGGIPSVYRYDCLTGEILPVSAGSGTVLQCCPGWNSAISSDGRLILYNTILTDFDIESQILQMSNISTDP